MGVGLPCLFNGVRRVRPPTCTNASRSVSGPLQTTGHSLFSHPSFQWLYHLGRAVFAINRRRFPDPARLFKQLSNLGLKIMANIKPYVLETHPAFRDLAEQGSFFETPNGKVALTRLWCAGLSENGRGSWGTGADFLFVLRPQATVSRRHSRCTR